MHERRGVQRVPLSEAARILGVSKGAVRQRVRRGTLRSDKGDDGRVYVYLDAYAHASPHTVDAADPREQLIAQLRSEVEAWREESRRKDHIIAGLVERLPPQLEAPRDQPPEPPGAPSEATEQPGRVAPQPAVQSTQAQESPEMAMPEAGGAPLPRDQQTASERPWWRRMFGG